MPTSSEQKLDLCRRAAGAANNAYAPYSRFHVGAALLSESGDIQTGCNVENGSFGLTICAERVAIGTAVAAGQRQFVAIAISTSSGVTPCGACRQVLNEFAKADCEILICNHQGDLLRQLSLGTLLPESFDAPSE